MPSVGHVAVGLAAARFPVATNGRERVAWALTLVILSCAPDADVIAFALGIPYAAPFGHRGATHSLVVAALCAAAVAAVAAWRKLPARRMGLIAGLVVASHGLLDTLTDGGLGCALLWPFSNERFFAPWTPIPVAPIGRAFLSLEGARIAAIELAAFVPFLIYAIWPALRRGRRATR